MSSVVEIYSVGDAAFLAEVMNSLAAISGSGNLETVVGIGILVGLIMEGFRSIMKSGEGIQFQNILVVWIIYVAMFGGTKDVIIQDIYTSTPYPVDNVPQGIAFVGGMTSKLGVGITQLFEVGYGDVAMTEKGFGFASAALADLRKSTLTQSRLGSANSPRPGDDMWKSWNNYIQECTLAGVALEEYSIDDIAAARRSPGGKIQDQLRFDSDIYGTRIYLDGAPNGGNLTCTDAFTELNNSIDVFHEGLCKRLAQEFGINSGPGACNDINTALATTLGQVGTDSQNYMIATALTPIFDWSVVANEVSAQRSAQAMMIHQSLQQRNDQWAAEQTLFESTVRPMMTFFEGLLYSITPLMAFLMGLGPMGFKMLGKYLMMAIWIQLWLPVLSIVNLYLAISIRGEMNALQNTSSGNMAMESFYGINAIDQTLQTWIATGGMLASSVPAITLMLVYGSAVTATSLAGKLGSAPNPQAASPDMLSNGPVMNNAHAFQNSRGTAITHGGMDKALGRYDGSAGWDNTRQSAYQEMETSQQGFQSSLSQSIGDSGAFTAQNSQASLQKFGNTASYTESDKLAQQMGERIAKNYEASTGETLGMGSQTALGAAMGAGGQGAAMRMSAGVTNTAENTEVNRDALTRAIESAASGSQDLQSQYQSSVSDELANGESSVASEVFQWSDNEQVAESNQEMRSASESYQSANSASQAFRSGRSLSEADAVSRVNSSPELKSQLSGIASDHAGLGINAHAEQWANDFGDYYGMNRQDALTAGQLDALNNPAFHEKSNEFTADSSNFLSNLLGREVNQDGAGRNKGIAEEVPESVSTNLDDAQGSVAAGRQNVEEQSADLIERTTPEPDAVEGRRSDNQKAIEQEGATAGADTTRDFNRVQAKEVADHTNRYNNGEASSLLDNLRGLTFGKTLASGMFSNSDQMKEATTDTSHRDFNKMTPEEQREMVMPLHNEAQEMFEEQGFSPEMASMAATHAVSEALTTGLRPSLDHGGEPDRNENAQVASNVHRALAPEYETAKSSLENKIGFESADTFEDHVGSLVGARSDQMQGAMESSLQRLNNEATNFVTGEKVSLGGVPMDPESLYDRVSSSAQYQGQTAESRYDAVQGLSMYNLDHGGVDNIRSYGHDLMDGFDSPSRTEMSQMTPEERGQHFESATQHAKEGMIERGMPENVAEALAPHMVGQQLGAVAGRGFGSDNLKGFEAIDDKEFNQLAPEQQQEHVSGAIEYAQGQLEQSGVSSEIAEQIAPYVVEQSPDSLVNRTGAFGGLINRGESSEAKSTITDIAKEQAEVPSMVPTYGDERGGQIDSMVADLTSKGHPSVYDTIESTIIQSDYEHQTGGNEGFFRSIIPGLEEPSGEPDPSTTQTRPKADQPPNIS